nr:hypothetical protein [Tanacetum cinerariifolium]
DPWALIEAAHEVNVINQQHLQLDCQRREDATERRPWVKFSRNILWNARIPIPDDEWTMISMARQNLTDTVQKLGIQLANETIRIARIPLPAIDGMFDGCFSPYCTTDADILKATAELTREEITLAAIELEEEIVGVLTRTGHSLLRYDSSSLELGDGSSYTRILDTDNQNYLNELQGFSIDILTRAEISVFPSEDPWALIEAAHEGHIIDHIARPNENVVLTSSSSDRERERDLEDHIFWKNKGKAIELEEEIVGVLTRTVHSLLRYDSSSLELGDGSSHTRILNTNNQNYLNQGFSIDILTRAETSVFPSEDPLALIEAAHDVNDINQQHLQLDCQCHEDATERRPCVKFSRNILWNAVPDDEWTMISMARQNLTVQKLGIQLANETIRIAHADILKAAAELAREEIMLAGICALPNASMWGMIWVRDYLKCLERLYPHMQD